MVVFSLTDVQIQTLKDLEKFEGDVLEPSDKGCGKI